MRVCVLLLALGAAHCSASDPYRSLYTEMTGDDSEPDPKQVAVESTGWAEPLVPKGPAVHEMGASELAALLGDGKVEAEAELARVVFERVAALGQIAEGGDVYDALNRADGDALGALVRALSAHAGTAHVAVAGLTAVHSLATNFRSTRTEFVGDKLARAYTLADAGALEAAVRAMNIAGTDEGANAKAWVVQRAAARAVWSLCVGRDGQDGMDAHELPANTPPPKTNENGDVIIERADITPRLAASKRPQDEPSRREVPAHVRASPRNRAAEAGALDALVAVLRAHAKDRRSNAANKKKAVADLEYAFRAIGRICLGNDATAEERRAKALELSAVSVFCFACRARA